MPWSRWLLIAFLTWLPWLELRGSIPLGLAWGMPWLAVAVVALTANALLFWPVWVGMALLYERWLKHTFVRGFVERARQRNEMMVKKYGPLGMILFVSLPFPGTGVYTGTALAFLLGMPPLKAFRSVALGVLVDGAIITLVSTGVIQGLRWLSAAG